MLKKRIIFADEETSCCPRTEVCPSNQALVITPYFFETIIRPLKKTACQKQDQPKSSLTCIPLE